MLLSAGKRGSFYEGGIRVPAFVYWPGKTRKGTHVDVPVADFFPTLTEMAEADLPIHQPVDGRSIILLLTGQGEWKDRSLFWHLPAYHGNGKTNALTWQDPAGVIRKGQWKLIEHFEDGRLELYNIEDDIGEQHNLADKRPDLARNLLKELKQWQQNIKAPIPSEKNPAFNPSGRLWISNAHTRITGEAEKQIVTRRSRP